MNVSTSIFSSQFGAYSFKNYVPIIAAVIVAAVVNEIFHNARLNKQRQYQAERISKLRALVRKQRVRRDLALFEAEKQEQAKAARRAAARRRLFQSERRPVGDIASEESSVDSNIVFDNPEKRRKNKDGSNKEKNNLQLNEPEASRDRMKRTAKYNGATASLSDIEDKEESNDSDEGMGDNLSLKSKEKKTENKKVKEKPEQEPEIEEEDSKSSEEPSVSP